ncbi:MAG: hypothetical protein PWQ83_1089 [Thermosipho sp. (in: thermotogales)]|nr:hypothetical protein [Thermosipho sp. (in: thermotogales)]
MKKNKKIKKMKVLRVLIIIGLFVMVVVKKGTKKYPYKFLLHYVLGSGKRMLLPEDVAIGVEETLISSIPSGGVKHSTKYVGRGFWGRPTMFYLVGGFSYRRVKYRRDGSILIKGVDRYDWHHTRDYKGVKQYFTTPFPKQFVWVLSKIFGEKYFPMEGFPSGKPGISNRLWQELESVGAKSFDTYIRINIPRQKVEECVKENVEIKYILEKRRGVKKERWVEQPLDPNFSYF